ncbi:amidohydrolase [Nitriliruptoraceae bacterium ZYF776]|nr:amidohydrolase [Profundirhabdus halotolerans]
MTFDPAAYKIIDVDTHVVEPPDLWTARMPASVHDRIPHVAWHEDTQTESWFLNGQRVLGVGQAAMAGWHEFPPDHPRTWAEADPATWDVDHRLAKMDEYGIHAQVLYPNVALFDSKNVVGMADEQLQLDIIRTYNDWLMEWGSAAPERFVGMACLPFWNLEASLAELARANDIGHKGLIFSQDPSAFGLPQLTDRYWDPLWAAAQERGMPVNFHIATGDNGMLDNNGHPDNGRRANYASMGVSFFMSNARTISQLVTGGICHRFPELNFVSVESGIGWLPFALESLDWQWKNCGVHEEHPEYDLLPSEYYARQIYGTFWFEGDSALHAIDQLGADNVMYETDFPHPTSMSPGPATTAVAPQDYLRDTFAEVAEDDMRKILHDNAARIYHLDG